MHGPLDGEHSLERLAGCFGSLVPGIAYRVERDFEDFDGDLHRRGESWRFEGHGRQASGECVSLFVRLEGRGVYIIRLLDDPSHQAAIVASPGDWFSEV